MKKLLLAFLFVLGIITAQAQPVRQGTVSKLEVLIDGKEELPALMLYSEDNGAIMTLYKDAEYSIVPLDTLVLKLNNTILRFIKGEKEVDYEFPNPASDSTTKFGYDKTTSPPFYFQFTSKDVTVKTKMDFGQFMDLTDYIDRFNRIW